MSSLSLDELVKLKNQRSSTSYEDRYVRWASLSYDLKTLNEFLQQYQDFSEENSEYFSEELEEMNQWYTELVDPMFAEALLLNKHWAERQSAIEKWGRVAALDIITTGAFSRQTLGVITNFPQSDYQLVIKRCQELVGMLQDITSQADNAVSKGIPGV
jgi:hypothetical protein